MPILNCVRLLAFSTADIKRVMAGRITGVNDCCTPHGGGAVVRARSVTVGEFGVVCCCDQSKTSPVGEVSNTDLTPWRLRGLPRLVGPP